MADFFGKQHKDVLRDIRNLLKNLTGADLRWFRATTYRDDKGEERPCYEMTRRGLALRPGLPFTMLDEAVAAVIPDEEGLTAAPARLQGGAGLLTPAIMRQEVTETLAYALHFGLGGRPRRTGHEHLAPLAAAQLAEHLMRSGLSILRRVPKRW